MGKDELISILDRGEVYYGELVSENHKAEGFANFSINPLRPNDMRVILTHLSGEYLPMAAHRSRFTYDGGSFCVSACTRGQSRLQIHHSTTIEDGVDEFSKLVRYNFISDPIVASTSYQFLGPLPPILAGRDTWPSKVQLDGVEIELSEESLVEEISNDHIGIPIKIAYRQGKMAFDLPGTFEESSIKARKLADNLDLAISIFSQDRISWHREVSKRYSAQHQEIDEQELIRWAIQPKGIRTDYRGTGGSLNESIGVLATAIAALPPEKTDVFEKIFGCFQHAWLAPYFELWLVAWHASLDVFRDYHGFEGPKHPFTQGLVGACEKAGVTFNDLFTNDRIKLLSGKEQFKFTVLRNEYLHKGMIIEDFHITMTEIEKMKSLAYRFLLRFLNLDEHFCNLDNAYIP